VWENKGDENGIPTTTATTDISAAHQAAIAAKINAKSGRTATTARAIRWQ